MLLVMLLKLPCSVTMAMPITLSISFSVSSVAMTTVLSLSELMMCTKNGTVWSRTLDKAKQEKKERNNMKYYDI